MIFSKLLACLLSLSILAIPVPIPRKNRQGRLRIKGEST
jgi:hypothetical protein